jgi:uncharacterized protein YbbK (DUF523 family)
MTNTTKIYIAVSACLTGEKVRYDATSKTSTAVIRLAEHFELVKFCPEMIMGLGAPRETLSLHRQNGNWQIIGDESSKNYTALSDKVMAEIQDICGDKEIAAFVLKSKSPSCALNTYSPPQDNSPRDGLIAERLRLKFPSALFIDEQRLENDQAFAEFVHTLKHES